MSDWIPVEERLPERRPDTQYYSRVPCLVTHDGVVQILVFNHVHECWDDETGDDYFCNIESVTAWMPLPEPYRSEK